MVSNTAPILTTVIVIILCQSNVCSGKHTIVKRNVAQLAREMVHYCGWVKGYELMDYGCYCGQGGYGEPMDNLDRCCKAHDDCYAGLEQQNYYSNKYDYQFKRTTIECNGAYQHKKLCECDKILLECVLRSEYHSDHYDNCPADKK